MLESRESSSGGRVGMELEYDKYALASVDQVYEYLKTRASGLTDGEIAERLGVYGRNILPTTRKISLTSRTILQLKNAFNLLLMLASALSFFSGFVYSDPGSVQMGSAIVAVVVINVLFSIFQEYRAEEAVKTITRMIPTKSKAVRGGEIVEVDVSGLVPGDLVVLNEGDRVPADLRLVSAFEATVDNSILTGESETQRRFVNMTPGMTVGNVAEYQNLLFAGSTMVTGVARGVVLVTGVETQFGRIVSLSRTQEEPLSPLQREINYAAKVNLVLSLAVGASFFMIAKTFINLSIVESILFAIGVMICLVPEGFQLTVSLSLALTALNMARRNVVVKRLSAIETMGSMTVLCVDKTGTITSGEMMVERLWANGELFDVSGDGYSPEGFVTMEGRRIRREDRPIIQSLFEVAAFCTNAKLVGPTDRIGRWMVLGDPTDGAFLVFAGKGDFNVTEALSKHPRVGLLPFDSYRRMMTVVHGEFEGGLRVYTKGSPYDVLSRCSSIYLDNEARPLTDESRGMISGQINRFAGDGYRVLALASKQLNEDSVDNEKVEQNLTLLGLAALHDPPRPRVEAAVQHARKAGVRVVMVTGDHELTAEAIARKVSIITQRGLVITGEELNSMAEEELSETLDAGELVFARTSPEHKLRIVKALMSKGDIVAVTGDGVNDSPALIEANVGVAMGVGGTDVARESADIILLDNDFSSIVEGLRLGRSTFDNLKKFVYYVYSHNFAELMAFLAFIILRTPLPLLVVHVLVIDLILEIPVSLALIAEPPEPDIMTRLPKSRKIRLMSASTIARASIIGGFIGCVCILFAFSVWSTGGWRLGDRSMSDQNLYIAGTTVVLVGIMAGQLGNLLSTRTGLHSAFSSNPLRNVWIPLGILVQQVILVAVVYVPFLQGVLGTASLRLEQWLSLYYIALGVILIEEIRKYVTKLVHDSLLQERSK